MKLGSLLTLALISAGAAHAAEKIRYEQLAARLAPSRATIKAYGVKVTTLDGAVHKSRSLDLQASQIRLEHGDLSPWETISSGEVARIEIRTGRRVSNFTAGMFWGGLFPVVGCFTGWADGCFLFPFVTPALDAVSAASAPVTLAVDGVELLIPPKVYEIIH